jgi:methylmalonyl-CoA mutase C-terminal domain/subunit
MKGLKEKGLSNILVIGGGVIPPEDSVMLKQDGIAEIFGPGTSTETIISFIKEHVPSS